MKTRPALPLVCTYLAITACALQIKALRVVTPDTWMSLVLGRAIATEGLPRWNTLTLMGHGAPWIDQQWLAHLAWYWVFGAGGFFGLVMIRLALSLSCLGVAALSATRRGASALSTSVAGVVALLLVRPLANVRAQAFGELCFAVLLFLLLDSEQRASEGRRDRRLLLAVPLVLALWANVHGSVLLGILLVVARVFYRIVDRRRGPTAGGPGALERGDWVLLVASAASVFASPYGPSLVSYYRATVVGAGIRQFAIEWQPPSFSEVDGLSFYVVAALSVTAVVRQRRRVPAFESSILLGLALLGCIAVRNVLFFGLAFAFIAPRWIDEALPGAARARGTRRALWVPAWVAIAVACAWASILSRSYDDWIGRVWPARTAAEVAELAGTTGRVFAVEKHADRLLWQRPELAGRMAYDVRLELLSREQMTAITDAVAGGPSDIFRGYDVVVVRADTDHLAGSPAWRRVSEDPLARVYVPLHDRRAVASMTNGRAHVEWK